MLSSHYTVVIYACHPSRAHGCGYHSLPRGASDEDATHQTPRESPSQTGGETGHLPPPRAPIYIPSATSASVRLAPFRQWEHESVTRCFMSRSINRPQIAFPCFSEQPCLPCRTTSSTPNARRSEHSCQHSRFSPRGTYSDNPHAPPQVPRTTAGRRDPSTSPAATQPYLARCGRTSPSSCLIRESLPMQRMYVPLRLWCVTPRTT